MFENIQIPIFYALVISFLVSFISSFLLVNINSNYKTSKQTQKRLSSLNVPPLGGVGMAISFFLSVRLLGKADDIFVYISFFALAITFLGVIDDFYNLNWKVKIIFQFMIVAIPIIFLNIFINIENIFGFNFDNYLNLIFTIFWIILLINSINFIDNMDGFAGVNTSFICLALGIISFLSNQNYLADVSFVLLFSIAGFFVLNFPPAKIYMGDSGSLFIGFILGFISILFDWNPTNEYTIYSSFAPVLLFFSIPLLDFITVFTSRIKNNISPTTGGTDHISHRLLKSGKTVRNVLGIMVLINIVIFSLLSLSIVFDNYTLIFLITYTTLIIFLFIKFLKMEILD